MRESGYYPPGAEFDPSAPYNEVEVPEKDFNLTISQSLSKDVTVYTNNYTPEYDEEDGHTYANTEGTDWPQVYIEEHLTPLQLIGKFKECLEQELEEHLEIMKGQLGILPNWWVSKRKELEHLIEECCDWSNDETEIIEN